MRKVYLRVGAVALLSLLAVVAGAQAGTWAWMNGSSGANGAGVYGTQGVPGSNNMPRALYEAASWEDEGGNFWIYGGADDSSNMHCDLWMFNPVNNEWTWVMGPGGGFTFEEQGTIGVPSPTNTPGQRGWGTITWTDLNNNLWLMGGGGYGPESTADLWMYNISTNEWTCMQAAEGWHWSVYGTPGVPSPNNRPGQRIESTTSWVDFSGNLWLFGGMPYFNSTCNELWMYDISIHEWIFMNGDEGYDLSGNQGQNAWWGNYGKKGVPRYSNQIPARDPYACWQDQQGRFYIMGGLVNEPSASLPINDVWRYDFEGGNVWTWVAGDSVAGGAGTYTTYCAPDSLVEPSARFENRAALSGGCNSNKAFFFGGASSGLLSYQLNVNDDLWMFDCNTNQWAWLSGPATPNSTSYNYGTLGVPDQGNLPPPLMGNCIWMDGNNNIWIFGGYGTGNTKYNAMWKFTPDFTCGYPTYSGGVQVAVSTLIICRGDSAQLTITNGSGASISPQASATTTDGIHFNLFPDTTTTFIITASTGCSFSDTAYTTLTVTSRGKLNYTADTVICRGGAASLSILGQSGITISPEHNIIEQGPLNYYLEPDTTTTYLIKGNSTTCGGADSAYVTIHVTQYLPVTVNILDSIACVGYGSPITIVTSGLYNRAIWAINISEIVFIDSSVLKIYTGYYANATPVILSGQTSCGSYYADTFTGRWLTPESMFYSLSAPQVCRGDTMLLTVYGDTVTSITPLNGVTRIDSSHFYLYPDTSTHYYLRGHGVCNTADTLDFFARILQPNVLNDSLPLLPACPYSGQSLYIYGLNNIAISPSAYAEQIGVNSDSGLYWLYWLYLPDTTSFLITGQPVCGTKDTFQLVIPTYPVLGVSASKTTLCFGDTVLITLSFPPDSTFSIQYSSGNSFYTLPDSEYTWVDSTHLIVRPDTSCYYAFFRASSGCFQNRFIYFTVSSNLQYTLSDTTACPGSTVQLKVYSSDTPQITPYTAFINAGSYYYTWLHPVPDTVFAITGNNECGQHETDTITLHAYGAPVVTVSKANLCHGDSTLIVFSNVSGVQITPPPSSRPDSINAWLKPLVTTNYIITGVNICSNSTFTFDTTITVSPDTFQISVSPSIACLGAPVSLCVPPGFYRYYWSNGQTTWCISTDTIGTWSVTATDAFGCHVTAAPVSPALIIPTPIGYNIVRSSNCAVDTGLLIVYGLSNVSIINPVNTRLINSATDTSRYYVYPDADITYLVTGTKSCGIQDTLLVPVLVSVPGYTLTDTLVCAGDSALLKLSYISQAQIQPVTGLYFVDSATVWVAPVVPTHYIITGYNNCTGAYVSAFTFTVDTLNPNVTVSKTVLCGGDTGHLCAISGLSAYHWSSGQTTACINTNNSGTYSVTTTDSHGCSAVSVPVNITIDFTMIPLTPDSPILCLNDSARLCAGNGFSNYRWSTGQTTTCIEALAGQYLWVNATDSNNCLVASRYYAIPLDQPAVTISANYNLIICKNDSVALCATSGFAHYLWSSGQTSTCIEAKQGGSYTVTVTDNHPCPGASAPVIMQADTPQLSITVPDTVICEGRGMQICATQGFYSYSWSMGYSAGYSQCATLYSSGNIEVTATDAYCNIVSAPVHIISDNPVLTVTPGGGTICYGDSVRFCATPGYVSYNWGNGPTHASCIEVYAQGNYNVTVTDTLGCSVYPYESTFFALHEPTVSLYTQTIGTNCTGSVEICPNQQSYTRYIWSTGQAQQCILVRATGSYTLTITDSYNCTASATPVALAFTDSSFAITPSGTTFCSSDSALVCAPPGYSRYLWSNGLTGACIEAHRGISYTVIVTDMHNCTAASAPYSFVSSNLSVTITAPDTTSCINDSLQICATAGFNSYQWSTGQTSVCTEVYSTGSYNVTVTDNHGCTAVATPVALAFSDSSLELTVADTLLCENDSLQICAPGSFSNYSWGSGQTTACIEAYNAGNYSVTVTDNHGCVVSSPPMHISADSPVVILLASDTILCQGESVRICATQGYTVYQWNSGQTVGCIEITAPGSYSITATDNHHCSAVAGPVFITQNSPVARLSVTDTAVCAGDSVHICATAGLAAYQWSTGAQTTCVTTSAGSYNLTVTDEAGCSATVAPAIVSLFSDTSLVISHQGDTLQANSGANVQWYFNGTAITGANGHTLVTTRPGSYSVTALSFCGNQNTASFILITGIGTSGPIGAFVNIYPNPTTGQLIIQTQNFTPKTITIYDDTGRQINTLPFKNEIDISNFSSGIYLMEITGGEIVARKKFVKM